MKTTQTHNTTYKLLIACLVLSGALAAVAQTSRAPSRKPDGEDLFDEQYQGQLQRTKRTGSTQPASGIQSLASVACLGATAKSVEGQ